MLFLDYLKRLTRIDLILLVASGGLLLGAVGSWYTLPQETLDAFGCSLWLPRLMRLIPLSLAVVVLRILWKGSSTSRQRRWVWAGLVASLLFPFLVAQFSAKICFIASAFDMQREKVANHIETHFPDVQAQWKRSIQLDTRQVDPRYVPESTVSVWGTPWETIPYSQPLIIDGEDFFQASSWDRFVLEGLHYLPSFLGCAGHGWPITIGSLVTALLALYLAVPENFFVDIRRLRPWLLSTFAVVILAMVVPRMLLLKACSWHAQGKDHQAASTTKLLYYGFPQLRGDLNFNTLLVRTCQGVGSSSPVPPDFIKGIECWETQRTNDAQAYFRSAFAEADDSFLVRAYLSASYLRKGIELFDRGQIASAKHQFQEVAGLFPSHIQAIYYTMVAQAVGGDFPGSAKTGQMLSETQQYFRLPTIGALGQAYLHRTWSQYRAGELDEAWNSYNKSANRGSWE